MEVFDHYRCGSAEEDFFSKVKSCKFLFNYCCLRRLFSILFAVLLLFNYVGYRFVIDYAIQQERAHTSNRLNLKWYNDDELITIKAPINLPYYASSETFEQVWGSAEVDGVVYHFVKRRVYNDSLELLCLPDASKQRLQSVKNEITRLATDAAGNSHRKNTSTIKIILPEYCQLQHQFFFDTYGAATCTTSEWQPDFLPYWYATPAGQPPEQINA